MKKVYKKPMIAMEYFTLNQNIAVSCGYNDENYFGHPTQADKTNCGWDDGFGEIFWVTVGPCSDNYSPDLEIGEVCYNAPAGVATIFAS